MGRGRIISPDFWTDAKIVKLSAFARLFYIGTWNFAYCDKGHLADDPDDLKLKILPADQVDVEALLAEIMALGRIARITVHDRTFLHIPTFAANQTSSSDTRWKSRCPVCKLLETPETSGEFSKTLKKTLVRGEERKGEERKGGEDTRPPRRCPDHLNAKTSPNCFACRDARLAQQDWDAAQKNKPTPTAPTAPDPTTCKHQWTDNYCAKCLARKEDP